MALSMDLDEDPASNLVLNLQLRGMRDMVDDLDSDGEEKMPGPGRGNARSGARQPYFLHPPQAILWQRFVVLFLECG